MNIYAIRNIIKDFLRTVIAHHRKLVKWGAVILAVYTFVGSVILPSVVRPLLTEKLSEYLGHDVSVERVEINPFALSLTVKGFKLKGKYGSADDLAFDRLYVNIETLSVFKRGVIVDELALDSPYVNLVRNKDLTYNFSYLLELGGKEEKPREKSTLHFTVNNIRIKDGDVDFDDMPKGVKHAVTDINLAVPFVSNFGYYGNAYVQPSFSATVNGTPLELKGRTKPFADSLETEFDIAFDGVSVPEYLAYLPSGLNFTVKSGTLSVNTTVSYKQYKDGRTPEAGVEGAVELKALNIADKPGSTFFSLPGLKVDISKSNLLAREVSLTSVVLDSPGINVVREADGSINLLKLMPGKKEAKEEEKPVPFSLAVGFFRIAGGWVNFTDNAVKGPFRAVVGPVEVTAVNLNTVKGWKTQVSVSTKTDAGETVAMNSHLTIDPPAIDGTLDAGNVRLVRYAPYYPAGLKAEVRDGLLGFSTKFSYNTDKDNPEQRLDALSVSLDSLKIRKAGEDKDIVDTPGISISDTSVDLLGREVVLGSVRTSDGVIRAERYADGRINLSTLYEAGGGRKEAVRKAGGEKPWEVTVGELSVLGYKLDMRDLAAPEPVRTGLSKVEINGSDISTKRGEKGKLSAGLVAGGMGVVSLSGPVSVNPVTADVALKVKDVSITPAVPYFKDKVNMVVTDGYVSADGRVSLDMTRPDGMKLAYKGTASVNGLSTVDKVNAEDLLNWKSLYASGIDFVNEPMKLAIKEVSLTDFYAKIIVEPDRRLNIMPPAKPGTEGMDIKDKAVPQPAAPGKTAPAKQKPSKVEVEKVTVQGGRLVFTDRSLAPNFKADLSKMGGRVSGLSSAETKFAEVDVRAMYNDFAPIEVTGKVNPLRDDLFVDLKGEFTDIEMSPFTPYSGKYLGFAIKKGKLSLDLKYFIDKRKLDASNKIFIDQLTLGDPVDSPDATSLPVKLGLALLKDRNGEIHLDIPLTGSLDDPDFSIFSLVLKVVVNVIVKAVTSPFALLGSIFGGGVDLGYVEFGYGLATLDDAALSKLDALEKALYDRPALKLSIEGHADIVQDREALRKITFDRKLKAEKLKDVIGEKQAVPVGKVIIEPDEYEKYLTLAYKEGDFPKPRNFIGMLKKLPPEEMEKLLLTNIKITDDDLRQLASGRTAVVKEHILASGKVEPGRVFTVEPKGIAPEKEENVRDSRVVFELE